MTTVQQWLAASPFYCAHRGGSADWPEMTMYAYDQAIGWGAQAVEISVWPSADGVFVGSHDQSTLRVTGRDYDIRQTSWATLSGLRTINGGHPLIRLEQLLDRYPGAVIFIDDKPQANLEQLWALLASYPSPTDRFVLKSFWSAQAQPTQAQARGYRTWGFYYAGDAADAAATQARYDILGMEYGASQDVWDTMLAFGKPVMGHICSTGAQAATARGKGAAGIMAASVKQVIPYSPPPTSSLTVWDGTSEQPATLTVSDGAQERTIDSMTVLT